MPSVTLRGLLVAFLVRDWRIARTYRFALVLEAATAATSLAVTFFLGRAFAGADILHRQELSHGYFAFASVGLILLFVIESCVTAPSQRLREDQQSGTLEMLASTPVAPWQILMGSIAYPVTRALLNACVGLGAAVALFGLRPTLTLESLAAVCAGVAGAVMVTAAIGTVIAAMTLTVRRTTVLTAVTSTAIVLTAGLYYPTAVLPDGLREAAEASPVTWAVDITRSGLLNGSLEYERAIALLATGVLLLCLSALMLGRAFALARRNGDLNRV